MVDESGPLTFAALERRFGLPEPPGDTDDFPLPAWYRSVREVPLPQLRVGDISRACRQQLYVDYMVPLALAALDANPLAGELYEGELLISLKSVPLAYWGQHTVERQTVVSLVERVRRSPGTPDDIRTEAGELRSRVQS